MSERAVNPADYEPCADASPRVIAARKAAIRAAFNYRWTHSWSDEPHIATDEQIERCYENFEDNGAKTTPKPTAVIAGARLTSALASRGVGARPRSPSI